ncbi:hypothetical protein L0244_12590 [bacterium]|nr:hypothetical protein [bacterium]
MKPEFLEKTIRVWQPHYKKKLTQEDAREIAQNLSGFYRILAEWDAKEKAKKEDLKTLPKK